jgi:hypothetical protein
MARIEYAGQGEPLAHPRFPGLVDLGRALFSETRQRLITNGNYDYSARTGRRAPDEIYVSCDGAFQESYEKYRIGGDEKRRGVPAFVPERGRPRNANGRSGLLAAAHGRHPQPGFSAASMGGTDLPR